MVAATSRRLLPELSEQGVLLRRAQFKNRKTTIRSGSSPRATLWALYALAELWGVCHTIQTDLFPKKGQSGFGAQKCYGENFEP